MIWEYDINLIVMLTNVVELGTVSSSIYLLPFLLNECFLEYAMTKHLKTY